MSRITPRRALTRASNTTLQALERRQLLAAVSWDGGGDGVNWTSANNWSTNTLPTPADDVTISIAANPTINLAGANAVINSLTTDENLNLNSGTLSVAAASSASAAATISMNGATLTGAGIFTVNGPLSFNAGTMAGAGTLIAKGATTIGSGGAYNGLADARTLRIDGAATLTSASGYNTNVNTNARIRVASGGTLAVGNGSVTEGVGAIIVDAGGTLTRTAAGTGTVIVQVQNSGTVSAAAGATLNLNSSVTTGGTFSGAGTIQTYGGTHTFANASTTASVTYNHVGGTIDGAGTLTVNGAFNWTAGIIQGTGTLSLRGTSQLGFGGAYLYVRDTRTIRVDAGVTTLGHTGGYSTQIASGAKIAVGSGGTLESNIVNGDTRVFGDGGNGTGAINVEAGGKFTRTAATGNNNISIPVNNLGTLDVDAGTLSLNGGGTNAAANTPAAGATLGLAGNWTYNDGTTFSGGGTVGMYTGSHTVNDGPAAATINVAGDGTTLSVDTGTFEGAGQTNVAAGGTFAFRRGVMQGTAVTTVFGTTLVGAGNGYSSIQGSHTLRVRGAGSFGLAGGYDTRLSANARLVAGSGGTLDISSPGDFQMYGIAAGNVGAVVVEPGGTLTRTAAGQEFIDVPVYNQGGTIRASTGARLLLNAGSTHAAGSTVAGPGNVQFRFGSHSIDGATTVAVGGLLELGSGTLAGTSTLTVAGNFDIIAGALAGSATTLVTGTANVGSGSGYLDIVDTHNLRVANGGLATHTTANGYDVQVGTDARISVANGGTYNFGATGADMRLFGFSSTNYGMLVVEAGGTFTRTFVGPGDGIELPIQNAGTIRAVAGADLGIGGGSTQLAGATIAGPGRVFFDNGTTHTISGTTTVVTGATLVQNNSTINGAASLIVEGTLNVNNGTQSGTGTTVIRGTTSTLGSGNAYVTLSGSRNIRVEGTLTHTTGNGYNVAVGLNARITVANGGTYVFGSTNADMRLHGIGGADYGLLVIDAGGTLTRTFVGGGDSVELPVQNNGTIRAVAGAELGLLAGSVQNTGATLAGPGFIHFNGGTHTIAGTTTVPSGARLLTYTSTLDGAGTLIVDGTLNMNGGNHTGSGTTLIRSATSTIGAGNAYFTVTGSRNIRVEGLLTAANGSGYDTRLSADARITIANGGTFDFSGPNPDIFGVGGAAGTGLFVIEAGGTLTRTAAGGDSLALPVQNAGTIRAAAGSELGIIAGSTQLAGATIAGPGFIHFNGGTHTVAGTTTVVSGGRLIHYSSTINGAGNLVVDGTYNFNGGSNNGSGTTVLRGTTSTLGAGNAYTNVNETRTLRVEGTATVSTGGGYDIRFAGGANLVVASTGTLVLGGSSEMYGVGAGNIGTLTIETGGTMQRAVGGTAPISMSVVNLGTVRIDAGAINFIGATNADDGAFLSSGRYLVFSGANLGFSPALTTLTADVELSGTASATGLGALAVNRGRVGLVNGADGQFDPAGATRFRNEGIIDLSPTSVLTVVGGMDFGGTSQPIVRSEIASATDFGRIVVTGASLNLNSPDSTSRFDPDLVGGYDPAIGTQFPILTGPSRVNSFDSIQGGLTPSNNVIGAYSNATTYGAVIVAGPAPAAPQILSQSYEYETRQAVVFTFDQDVSAFLSRKDYTIMNLTTNQALPQSAGTLTFNTTSNTATLLLTNQMPNGDYRLTVNASDIANSVGVPASGAPITLQWYVLAGDVNRDRVVGFADLLIIAQNYGLTGKTFTQGNANYSSNGTIDFDDLLILAQNYGVALSVAPPTKVAASTRQRTVDELL